MAPRRYHNAHYPLITQPFAPLSFHYFITVLDDKSPQALTKNAAEDEVEINVDFIVPRVFHELNHYVTNLVQGGNKMGNKVRGKIGAAATKNGNTH